MADTGCLQKGPVKVELTPVEYDVWLRHKKDFSKGTVMTKRSAVRLLGIRLVRRFINAGIFDEIPGRVKRVRSEHPRLVHEKGTRGCSMVTIQDLESPISTQIRDTKAANSAAAEEDQPVEPPGPTRVEILLAGVASLSEDDKVVLRAAIASTRWYLDNGKRSPRQLGFHELETRGFTRAQATEVFAALGVGTNNARGNITVPRELEKLEF